MKTETPVAKLLVRRALKALLPSSWWNRIRSRRIERVISSFKPRDVLHTYAGFPLKIRIADPLGESWYDHDWAEYPDFPMLRKSRLREGSVVFDIGAHQGIVALILAKIVGPSGLVLAVEANAHNARIAEINGALNEASQLKVIHAAASDLPGKVSVNLNLNGQVDLGDGEWGQQEVEALTIDGMAAVYGAPDVLFLDVEGFECQVLRGATKTLENLPDCCVEVHVDSGLEALGGSIDELLSFFPEKLFDLYICPEDPHDAYVPFMSDSPILKNRFFLVALRKQSSLVST